VTTVHQPMSDGWTVRPAEPVPELAGAGPVSATVPGCVHTDLLAAGLIPDPYLDDNERVLSWIGDTDWVYETTVTVAHTGGDRIDLVCEGLDTVATVTVNDVEVGRTVNMHRGYRFDVGTVLRPGPNSVRVHFASAVRYAAGQAEQWGARPHVNTDPYNMIRKNASNFGWDWGPRLVTAGIWQPIGLHTWSTARLGAVRPVVTVADGRGRVEVHAEVERADAGAPLTVRASLGGDVAEGVLAAGATSVVLTLTVADPALWWPRGYGEQPLYPLQVTLSGPGAEVLGSWQRRIGFRTVRLDTADDEHGSAFTLIVNEMPVFVRGANWIPDDVFLTRVDRDRYARRMRQALDAGMNLLRVWGGGRYEAEDFYELADEQGLLVWQDFLFACAAYPEEGTLPGEVEAEAREQVTRLAAHPSLVLWVGNNENFCGWFSWGWQQPLAGRTWGAAYYLDVLPRVVAELDPTRPYWPGSPYSGSPDRDPDDFRYGNAHIWDVWNTHDYTLYREKSPRFAAEFGYQGPPAYATLRRAISDEPLASDSPGMAVHQKAGDGDRKLRAGLEAHLPDPRDFDDWHYLTQVNQARALQLGIEHFRSLRPLCMGTVVWQLNDCWPVTSWAAVDGDGRRKPLWYALRRAYRERLLTIQPRSGVPAVVAVNETGRPWRLEADVRRLTVAGELRARTRIELEVPAYGASTVVLPAELTGKPGPEAKGTAGEVLLAESESTRAWWWFAEDRVADLPAARFDAVAKATDDGVAVTVTAHTLLRDLTLFPDRLDPAAEADDAMITLLPGETATFTVRTSGHVDPAALTARPVLRCVNDMASRDLPPSRPASAGD
jgi:beta-mannosidase